MLTLKVNGTTDYTFDISNKEFLVNGTVVVSDWISIGANKYHVLFNNQSFTVELMGKDESGKALTLNVNGRSFNIQVQDQYDVLLKQLGMDKLVASKVNEVKAPMPGLVLRLLVEEGQAVKKGDALLVLEAMKMENIIKSAGEGIVKTIKVEPRQVVDKNQVMVVMA
jgi:biotin carboxyl carrier protein